MFFISTGSIHILVLRCHELAGKTLSNNKSTKNYLTMAYQGETVQVSQLNVNWKAYKNVWMARLCHSVAFPLHFNCLLVEWMTEHKTYLFWYRSTKLKWKKNLRITSYKIKFDRFFSSNWYSVSVTFVLYFWTSFK